MKELNDAQKDTYKVLRRAGVPLVFAALIASRWGPKTVIHADEVILAPCYAFSWAESAEGVDFWCSFADAWKDEFTAAEIERRSITGAPL
jgi:hypothetical protein